MSDYSRYLEDENRYLHHQIREERKYTSDLRQMITDQYVEAERVCRVLTDIADTIRKINPEMYRKVIAPVYDGEQDPRPDWFLDQEYAFRIV